MLPIRRSSVRLALVVADPRQSVHFRTLFPLVPLGDVGQRCGTIGQALIGNVRKDGGGKDRSPTLDLDSSSQQVADAPHPALRSPNAERELVPGAGDAERPMSDARRTVAGSPEGK